VPVFGFIAKQNNIISFISSMNLLLEAGVLMLQALEIAADVVPNILYKQAIIRIKNEVEVGVKFSVSMKNGVALSGKQSPLFPDDFVHMV
jgi:type II secretory pathway component PulF